MSINPLNMTEDEYSQMQREFYSSSTTADPAHMAEHKRIQQERLQALMEEDDEPDTEVVDDTAATAFDATTMRAAGEVIDTLANMQIANVQPPSEADLSQWRNTAQDELDRFLREYRAISDPKELAARVVLHVQALRSEAYVAPTRDEVQEVLERCWLLDVALDTPAFIHGSQQERGMLRVAQARVDHLKAQIKRHYEV